LNVPSEVILVNDGNTDRSWEVIVSLSGRHSWIRGINLMRNYGKPLKETHGLARDLASRITKLALQSAIGAEAAAPSSAMPANRTN
jgi:hypothetical protein